MNDTQRIADWIESTTHSFKQEGLDEEEARRRATGCVEVAMNQMRYDRNLVDELQRELRWKNRLIENWRPKPNRNN